MRRIPEPMVYAGLFIFTLLAYAQIGFMSGAVKYDMIDCTYAWRYFLSESLRNGYDPLWNPYQVLGYPFFADLQSGYWYPWFRIHAFLRPYDIYGLHIDFILHAWLGVAGFYLLLRRTVNRLPAALGAAAYICSGFYLGHSQHFYFLITASWLPWAVFCWLRLWEHGSWKKAAALAGTLFMLFTGGYMALHIIFGWILLVFLLTGLARTWEKDGFPALWKKLKWQLLTLVLLLPALAGLIYSLAYIWPEMSRTDALSLEDARFNPLSPQSLISFLYPLAAEGDMEAMGTDLSTSNIYMGWLGLLLPFFGWKLLKRNWFRAGLLLAGLFCLLAAMGEFTPVHEFTYRFLPFGGVFRLPSIYRYFFIFAWLWLGAEVLQSWLSAKKVPMFFIVLAGLLALLSFGIFLEQRGYRSGFLGPWLKNNWGIFPEQVNLMDHLTVNALYSGLIWGTGLLVLWFYRNGNRKWWIIACTALLDLFLNAQAVGPYTVFSHKYSPAYIDSVERHFTPGFPVPENVPLARNDDQEMHLHPYFRNSAQYRKRPGRGGFTSFFTRSFLQLDANAEMWDYVGTWPLAATWKRMGPKNTADYSLAISAPIEPAPSRIRFVEFNPEKISLEVQTDTAVIFTLTQQQLPYCNYTVNGVPAQVHSVAYCLPGLYLPAAGNYRIERTYNLPFFDTIKWFSIVGCLLILTLLLWPRKYSRTHS